MKIDYMVSADNGEPETIETLSEARKLAKELSLTEGQVTIQKWKYNKEIDDMEVDEGFLITYENGKDITKECEQRFAETVKKLNK